MNNSLEIKNTNHFKPVGQKGHLNSNANSYFQKKNNTKLLSEEEYINSGAWGLLTSIDLSDCNPEILRSGEKIKEHIIRLCEVIEMKRFGEPLIVRFGSQQEVYGYSSAQLIESSLISGHYAEESNSVYIDIFSCKWYDQEKAIDFTKNFFKARKAEANVVLRGKGIAGKIPLVIKIPS